MKNLFHNWFTGPQGTFEIGRALWALSLLSVIVYEGLALWFKGQVFSPESFGIALATVLAAGGVGVGAKDALRPKE
jgi:hypothetical protein